MPNQEKQEFYTPKEIADILKLNIMTIYRYIKSKKIDALKIGKEFRIEKQSFDKFVGNSKIK